MWISWIAQLFYLMADYGQLLGCCAQILIICLMLDCRLYIVLNTWYLLLDLWYFICSLGLRLACYSFEWTVVSWFLFDWQLTLFQVIKLFFQLGYLSLFIEYIIAKTVDLFIEDVKLRRSLFHYLLHLALFL